MDRPMPGALVVRASDDAGRRILPCDRENGVRIRRTRKRSHLWEARSLARRIEYGAETTGDSLDQVEAKLDRIIKK